eukprot:2607239-Pyramimonas_sp.AAC.1
MEGEAGALGAVSRALHALRPASVPNLSVARYGRGDHISPHDDKILERYTRKEYRTVMSHYLHCAPAEVPLPPSLQEAKTAVFSREVRVGKNTSRV